jgi:hypothetical protein
MVNIRLETFLELTQLMEVMRSEWILSCVQRTFVLDMRGED